MECWNWQTSHFSNNCCFLVWPSVHLYHPKMFWMNQSFHPTIGVDMTLIQSARVTITLIPHSSLQHTLFIVTWNYRWQTHWVKFTWRMKNEFDSMRNFQNNCEAWVLPSLLPSSFWSCFCRISHPNKYNVCQWSLSDRQPSLLLLFSALEVHARSEEGRTKEERKIFNASKLAILIFNWGANVDASSIKRTTFL